MFKSRTIVFTALFMLMLNSVLMAVKIDAPETSFNTLFNFYAKNLPSAYAAGRGYTGVAGNGDLSLSIINPAAMDLSNVWEVFYEYQTKDDIHLLEYDKRVKFSSYRQTGSFGIGLKLDKVQAGITYYQRNNYDYSTCIKCLYNDVTVDSMNYHLKALITDFTVPIAYQVSDKMRLGASLTIGRYESIDPVPLVAQTGILEVISGKIDFNMIRFKLGFVASPFEYFSFGASIMPESKRKLSKEFGWSYGSAEYSENTFPTEINVGINYAPVRLPLKILADYNYSNDSVYNELTDRHDFNLGLEYFIKDFITLRTGFFTQVDYRDLNHQVVINGEKVNFWDTNVSYNQNFLTGGLSLNWKKLTFNAAFMDSNLISKGDIGQTYFILGTALNI